jgi:ABC-type transport system involved in multi-copper enzyme maturation permease subunit
VSARAAVAGRETSRPLSFASAARGVFGLTFDGMLWSRRSVLMAVLLGLPVVLSLVYRVALHVQMPRLTASDLYAKLVVLYYVRNVVPLVALFYATSLVADEVEAKTLTYLLTRPIRRAAILAGKLAAYLATTLTLSLPALVLSFFVLATAQGTDGFAARVPDLLRDLGTVALALVAYGALFTLLGVLLRRPMIPGLVFLFAWELLVYLPGLAPRLTITAYLRSLVSHRVAQEGLAGMFAPAVIPAGESLVTLLALSLALLTAAGAAFGSREYVMEQ